MSLFTRNLDRSSYFQPENYENERTLTASVMTEVMNSRSLDLRYYVRTYDTTSLNNKIFKESINNRYTRYFDFNGRILGENENKLLSLFGITQDLNESIFVTKISFKTASIDPVTQEEYIPKLGDVIEILYASMLVEITSIPKITDYNYFQNMGLMWEFVVRPFRDEGIKPTEGIVGTTLEALTNKPYDIFDNSNIIDSKKESVLYTPKTNESPQQNPYGNW